MKTKYLFPIISLGPPYGYEMDYTFALEKVKRHLPKGRCETLLSRYHFYDGKQIKCSKKKIVFDGDNWLKSNKSVYKAKSIFKSRKEWNDLDQTEYVETHMEMLSDKYFKNADKFQHVYYTNYYGKGKTFLSDNSFKYGAPRTTQQIKFLNEWCEGYPDCNLSRCKNLDESIIVINPFSTKASIKITFQGDYKIEKRLIIKSFSSYRLAISKLLPKNIKEWSGQIFVNGKHRLIIFFLKHALKNPSIITSLEHSEHFRGEHTHFDLSFYLKQLNAKIKKILR